MKRPERRPSWRARLLAKRPWLPVWRLHRPEWADLGVWRLRLRAQLVAFGRGRWGRRLTVGAAAAIVASMALAIVVHGPLLIRAIVEHPYFSVTEIVVTPTQHVQAGTLLEFADLRAGVSLWRVDPSVLAGRLESHPWIRRASVRREFPRRLIVELAEREPAAILFLDQIYYVDSTGVPFVRVGERDTLALPFVTGVEAAIMADERPFARHAIRQALRLLRLLQAAGLPFRVSEVHIEREQGITVFPIEPRLGLTFGWNGFGRKLTRLTRVLQDFQGRESRIREIDLTMGTTAVVRLRRSGAKGKRTRV